MKKKFKAVEFQRKVREELGEKYLSNREAFLYELEEKYGYLQRKAHTSDNMSISGFVLSTWLRRVAAESRTEASTFALFMPDRIPTFALPIAFAPY